VSHLLASVKACDAIMAVRIPPAAKLLRQLLHCAQMVQSHALSFFHLSAPDLLLGMESDPKKRNIVGLIEKHPEMARDGIALRRFGQSAIQRMAGERVHPSWTVPGGVNAPLSAENRDAILSELPIARSIVRRALHHFKDLLGTFEEEIAHFGNAPSMYAGLVSAAGNLEWYDGHLRWRDQEGKIAAAVSEPEEYASHIGEAVLPYSYLKAPYFKPLGYPEGVYRVGPLARLNVADQCGTPEADSELAAFRQRFGRMPQSAFLYHYARLIEALHGIEKMEVLLEHPDILSAHVRAYASVNAPEGVGIIEAPRGTLIHHYRVDERGAIQWANLIVATGHNNIAMNSGITQVAKHWIRRDRIEEGLLNRVSALVRAYDPCLSCSTHALGQVPLRVTLHAASGEVLDERSA
jgi:NAD-reducing hydrogenase large subunit